MRWMWLDNSEMANENVKKNLVINLHYNTTKCVDNIQDKMTREHFYVHATKRWPIFCNFLRPQLNAFKISQIFPEWCIQKTKHRIILEVYLTRFVKSIYHVKRYSSSYYGISENWRKRSSSMFFPRKEESKLGIKCSKSGKIMRDTYQNDVKRFYGFDCQNGIYSIPL